MCSPSILVCCGHFPLEQAKGTTTFPLRSTVTSRVKKKARSSEGFPIFFNIYFFTDHLLSDYWWGLLSEIFAWKQCEWETQGFTCDQGLKHKSTLFSWTGQLNYTSINFLLIFFSLIYGNSSLFRNLSTLPEKAAFQLVQMVKRSYLKRNAHIFPLCSFLLEQASHWDLFF